MDDDGKPVNPPPPPGPIEDAYLHRDVHPDEKPGHGHEHKLGDSDLFPKADGTAAPEDDTWMYT
ncbi:MAG: hypothetical protein QOE22_621 [Candidatus Parcubacteria bacterium]|jgi:hypothetical protein|nr:hypothetical protein [Candidatus Parcubacteria bacterium]